MSNQSTQQSEQETGGNSSSRSVGNGPFLSMGLNTYQISLRGLFGTNRAKLVQRLKEAYNYNNENDEDDSNNDNKNNNNNKYLPCCSVIYLVGGPSTMRYDSDHEPIFRNESYFLYLTGVKEPDFAVSIEVDSGITTLFIPKLPPSYAVVMGKIKSCDDFKEMYQVDDVQYIDDVESILEQKLLSTMIERETAGNQQSTEEKKAEEDQSQTEAKSTVIAPEDATTTSSSTITPAGTGKLLLMKGKNSDSGSMYEAPTFTSKKLQSLSDTELLFPILAECRVHKSPAELSLLQYVTELSSFGHAYVMRNIAAPPNGTKMMEYQMESLFRHYCYYNYGCRLTAYTPICGCGPNGAILHYGHAGEPNEYPIVDGQMCLFDMGAEYFGYASDITCSYPSNGTFTPQQRGIHTAVLNAQKAVYNMLKPGVSWVDCHKAAEYAIIEQLIQVGIVLLNTNTTIQDLVDMRFGALFMPHGLGHFIGLDTHDVGGYLKGPDSNPHPPRIMEPGLQSLRTARVLEENMVLTVEPGCYFIDHLLEDAMSSENTFAKYLNNDLINSEYRNKFGGVRLEDVVAITSTGFVNYTLCPRTIGEIEDVMTGSGKWPPMKDQAPELGRTRLCDTNPLPPPPSV